IKNITAKVADWETVEAANQFPSNAHVVLSLEDRGSDITENVNIYRAAEVTDALIPSHDITTVAGMGYNWAKKYEQPNVFQHDTKELATTWYWPDNKTFYHFRAVAPTTATVVPTPAIPQTSDAECYVQLTAKENYTDASSVKHSYTDVRWGAPFLHPISNTGKFEYGPTKNGFDGLDPNAQNYQADKHQIYHAIGATEDSINLIMFHAMSEVTIKVVSVTEDSKVETEDSKVEVDGAKIQLQNIYTQGKLMMGNGLVVGTGDKTNYDFQGSSSSSWTYGAIPQDLSGVVLDIKTTDGNHYKVNMGEVIATSVTDNNITNPYTGNKIDRWYPGFKYTYTFNLNKKKVQLLKCTIVEWEKVVAGDDNVQIQ
ncbi:MAG: fimbrillin family protein, partial [Alloprevotella sp.]